jgi:hypothetical protein
LTGTGALVMAWRARVSQFRVAGGPGTAGCCCGDGIVLPRTKHLYSGFGTESHG